MVGITNALTFIADYKRGALTEISGHVAVVGAGNTAIDAANASVRLGAHSVTMIYRRGPEQMSAFDFEYEHAKQEGAARFLWHVQPVALAGNGRVESLQLERLETTTDGSLIPVPNSAFDLRVDLRRPRDWPGLPTPTSSSPRGRHPQSSSSSAAAS